jgi:hypothetical protein
VEAWQHVELTSTNRPFGLIIKLTQTVDPMSTALWSRTKRIDVLRNVVRKDLKTSG